MITVNCPNCGVENSAIQRRCISCDTELTLEGHVRCENCSALTPENLEFCEQCGFFLAIARTSSDYRPPRKPREEPAPSKALPTKPPLRDEQVDDPASDESIRKPASEAEEKLQPEADETTRPSATSIPTWLLDIDAALKASQAASSEAEDTGVPPTQSAEERSSEPEEAAFLSADPVQRMDTGDLPEQPKESTDKLDWVNALSAQIEEMDIGTSQGDPGPTEPEPRSTEPDPVSNENEVDQPDDRPQDSEQTLGRRTSGTQPLDPSGKLLGVPSRLAATELPAWLSDQLQRPGDLEDEEIIDDIVLPEPPRVTFIQPRDPVVDSQQSHDEEPVLDPSFEQWLKHLSDDSASPDWMDEDQEHLDEGLVSDSVQVSAETPGWLRDIHEEVGDTAALLGIAETVETQGRLAGLAGAIQIAPAIVAPLVVPDRTAYTLPIKHQQQIAILEGIVHAEPVTIKRKTVRKRRGSSLRFRLLFGGVLLLLVLVTLLIPASTEWLPDSTWQPVSEQAQQLYDQIRLAEGSPVLIAFDYTPSMAGELNPIANVLLGQLAENDSQVVTVSQSAAGSEVAAIVAQEIDGLDVEELGYIPGEEIGLRNLSECLSETSDCENLFGVAASSEVQRRLAEVVLILVLTSDSESLISWIEQVGAQLEDRDMVAGVTQSLGPVANPYFKSGQLDGVIEGYPDVVAYERDLVGIESESTDRISSITLVIWLVVGLLSAGLIYYSIAGLRSSRRD